MEILPLHGQWSLFQAGKNQAIPATVPGCIHTDLLRNKLIDDPFYRDNERQQFWVAETGWSYTRTFEVSADFLAQARILLQCFGLDTLATITINDAPAGSANNMYRTWEFDVKPLLHEGSNDIRVTFDPPMPFLRRQEAEKGILYAWSIGAHRLNSGAWLRKMPSSFGWDWGPKLSTSGIWQDIQLAGFDARIADVKIVQLHTGGIVDLTITVQADAVGEGTQFVTLNIDYDGKTVASAQRALTQPTVELSLRIDNPNLWWPNGMGGQPLYLMHVALNDGARVQDRQEKRIGLRQLTLERHPDQWGESFCFACNGVPFFAKGANWIPINVYPGTAKPEDYRRCLQAVVAANMNMLRVWGGGIYELDEFYDLCDELGIAVWQDFMFACSTYPTFDAEWMINVRAEAEDNVRRLRHHASLALWCGNNELEQGLVDTEWTKTAMSWEDYGKLFDTLLPEVVARLDPHTAYWPASPHTPVGDRANWRNPDNGDTHLWAVWHEREPFEWYRTRPDRFCSEFGFQSFPEPATIYEFAKPADRNLTSPIMEYHQRSGIGNSTIIHYMLDWFRLPTSFEHIAWLSQILQGMAMKYAVEHWRRNMPRTMGTLYWQLNDLWPAPTWSSLDWKGNWKALHYMAKRFYAPLLISGVEDTSNNQVALYVTNDGDAAQGITKWWVTDLRGIVLLQGETAHPLPARTSALIHTLSVGQEVSDLTSQGILVFLELVVDGRTVADNLVLFSRPKQLELIAPHIEIDISHISNAEYAVTLRSAVPALYVWLELADAVLSDNFFHLRPGVARTLHVTTNEVAALRVCSLIDTYAN